MRIASLLAISFFTAFAYAQKFTPTSVQLLITPKQANHLSIYDTGYKKLVVDTTLKAINVRSITYDAAGKVYIGTEGHGLGIYQSGTWKYYPVDTNIGSFLNTVKQVYITPSNVVYVLSNKGLLTFKGNSFDTVLSRTNKDVMYASKFTVSSKGKIYLSVLNKLVEYSGQDRKEINKDVFSPPQINKLYPMKDGSILLATIKGLRIYDGGDTTKVVYNKSNMVSAGTYITDIAMDRQGIIWFTTIGDGIGKYDGEKITFIKEYPLTESQKMPLPALHTLAFSPDGTLYAASEACVNNNCDKGYSIFRMKKDKPLEYFSNEDRMLITTRASDLIVTPDGRIWMIHPAKGLSSFK